MKLNGMVSASLPGGYWCNGVCYREARLRPLNGEDEAFLIESGQTILPAQRITALLSRCLTRLGPHSPVAMEVVRSLTVGDREALLLSLRRLTLGDSLQCLLSCPHWECGEKIDLDLLVSELLLPPYHHQQTWYESRIRENGAGYRIRFRLPTGADQEEAAVLSQSDPQAAVDLVMHRCMEYVVAQNERPKDERPIEEIPSVVANRLPAIMAELDPQAELTLNCTCPSCGHAFSAIFDTAAYFFQEVEKRMKHLYREVHLLALHYHWSESEILSMTAQKRRRYLDLLSDSISEGRA